MAIGWIANADYPPRGQGADAALMSCLSGQSFTLAGCRILGAGDHVRICREFNVVRDIQSPVNALWDDRWIVIGTGSGEGLEVRPLGRRGLQECKDWRSTGRPNPSLEASPSVWQADSLVAAPLAGHFNGWSARLAKGEDDFYSSFLSH